VRDVQGNLAFGGGDDGHRSGKAINVFWLGAGKFGREGLNDFVRAPLLVEFDVTMEC